MAIYNIITTRQYEAALVHNHKFYAQPEQSKEQFFQQRINLFVLEPMNNTMKNDKSVNLTASLDTVPDANQAACQAAIEEDIVSHGGTIVTGPPNTLPPTPPPLGAE